MNLIKTMTGAILMLALFTCCDDESARTSGDYFPMENGTAWNYEQWIEFNTEEEERYPFGRVQLRIDGEITLDDKTYKRVLDSAGQVNKIVRRQGSQYFGRHHELYGDFSHEYVFLDLAKEPGESWSYIKNGGATKTEYIIDGKSDRKIVLGKEFKNVIEVRVNYYNQTLNGDYELWVTAWHYYAEGLGEIYYFNPYPVSFTYGDVSGLLQNK